MQPDRLTSTETILVVDDSIQNRMVLEGHLTAAGYRVIQAENGKQAVERFASDPADLVMLDLVMPVMDGFEACRRLRAMDRGSELPILFITAHGDLQTHEKAIESGADDFLSKPIQRVELLLRTKSLLRIRRLTDELTRKRDALLRAQEEKRRLSAMIVHDLRGPLSCVLGNLDFVRASTSLAEWMQYALRDVHTSAEVMDRMLNDLLDIARSEDGALKPRIRAMDVQELLDEVQPYMRGLERSSHRQINVECQPGMLPVHADMELIRRVVENLVDNSAKYAPEGTAIRLEVSQVDRERLLIKVWDRGPGVPPEFQARIFDQYVQLDGGWQAHGRGGRGLGLAFCKLAIVAHGGEIWVENHPAAGCAFCFWVPTAAAAGQVALAPARAGLEAA